jgi:hypothetical protein
MSTEGGASGTPTSEKAEKESLRAKAKDERRRQICTEMLDTEEAYARALGLLIEVENKMKNRLFIS